MIRAIGKVMPGHVDRACSGCGQTLPHVDIRGIAQHGESGESATYKSFRTAPHDGPCGLPCSSHERSLALLACRGPGICGQCTGTASPSVWSSPL